MLDIDNDVIYFDTVVKKREYYHAAQNMTTLKDIAKKANVSVKTVSRVINNEPYITDEKRERVLQIVRRLNYVPNPAARSLKGGKTQAIGVTTGGPNLVQVFHHPYMSRLYTGMAAALENTGYRLQFCHFTQVVTPQEARDMAASRFADGILYILLSVFLEQFKKDGMVRYYNRLGIPYVVIHSMGRDLGCPSVGVASEHGGCLVTRHLIEHGYPTVGFVGIRQETPHVEEMFAGYQKALAEQGLRVNPDHVYRAESFRPQGMDNVVHQIVRAKDRPRALFVAISTLTPRLLKELSRAGVAIPDELALIGFDEPDAAAWLNPRLTYLEQPALKKGRQATELLFKLISRQGLSRAERTVLVEPELVAGETCGCKSNDD